MRTATTAVFRTRFGENGMTDEPDTMRLSARDRKILDHVARYRITVSEILHALFFPDQLPNAVTKVTSRLCQHDYLRRFPLYHPRTYFTLGPKSAQLLGQSPHRTLPLGPQSLPTEFATLAYSTLGRISHQRLTAKELAERWSWMNDRQLLELPHCLDDSAEIAVLELIRVDLGGKPDHVARKCVSDIHQRRRFRPFGHMLKQAEFRLVVVTGTTEKAAAIRDALDQHSWPPGLQLHLAVIPDLLQLTARLSHGT